MQTRSYDNRLDHRLSQCAERLEPVQTFNQDVRISIRPHLNWSGLALLNQVLGDELQFVRVQRFRALDGNPDIFNRDTQLFQHDRMMDSF